MRAKKAKALRRTAEKATEGLPGRHLVCDQRNQGTALNSPNSTRGIYRKMKRVFKSL